MENSFYGDSIILLHGIIIELESRLDIMRKYYALHNVRDPIQSIKSRVKSENSMKEKMRKKGLPETLDTALNMINDAAGLRIICNYVDDVYKVVCMIKSFDDIKIIEEKDYIKAPKSSGYRSYHIILSLPIRLFDSMCNVRIEVQIRTIAMDCWASLEHQMKYKKDIENPELVGGELKKCADEIASTDLKLMAIRNMIGAKE